MNFKGVFIAIQKALPLIADNGSIVLNASWTLYGEGDVAGWASVSALHALTWS
ncbi:hypothetical protein ACTMTI_50165 [Nonomuraea sp. H19]|uniref:hypothetical protein n=1 Tax=Nonomuraea sp. H19 TaxID=3452206 RepID=UPI003F8937A2